ncbi:MAG TPA: AbrB/MazE/SpoVT family DNA-binding domain-containing protein [Gammaproteobacteria bacterium]|nr:AbrB/MazE/SpoVT family DNA-binding domain-containing protein [Gammaproteobacteria bacterium]
MKFSTITSKGQATIPLEIRKQLDLHTGDRIAFEIVDGKVVLHKLRPFDYEYHRALSKNLSEWDSQEDDEAYEDL